MLDVGTFKEIHSICLNISNTSLLFNTQNMTYKNATLKKCNKKSSIESVKRNVECKMDRYFCGYALNICRIVIITTVAQT